MRTLLIVIALFTGISYSSAGQTAEKVKKIKEKEANSWFDGTIVLSDETKLNGKIRYDRQNGFASFNDGNNNVTVYKNAEILMMSFYDKKFEKQRTFYSIPFEDNAMLFEVLAEFKKLAILSRLEQPKDRKKGRDVGSFSYRSYIPGKGRDPVIETAQTELIYMMNEQGTLTLYMEILHREDGEVSIWKWSDDNAKVVAVYEEALPKILPEEKLLKLEQYAKENRLSFKSSTTLIEIFEKNRNMFD